MPKNKNIYSKYFNQKYDKYKESKGRKKGSAKLLKEFLSDKKTAAALQKNVRRYYKRGDIIDLNKIPAAARSSLVDAIDFEKTIERQRTKKKKKTAEEKRAEEKKKEAAATKILFSIIASGNVFYFLDAAAIMFIIDLQKDPAYKLKSLKEGVKYSSQIRVIDNSEDPEVEPTPEDWSEASKEGQNIRVILSNRKEGRKWPVYNVWLLERNDEQQDIGIEIVDFKEDTP